MELTKEFVLAVEKASRTVREEALKAADLPETKKEGSVGRIVRKAIERDFQTADLLDGWSARARAEIGMEPRG